MKARGSDHSLVPVGLTALTRQKYFVSAARTGSANDGAAMPAGISTSGRDRSCRFDTCTPYEAGAPPLPDVQFRARRTGWFTAPAAGEENYGIPGFAPMVKKVRTGDQPPLPLVLTACTRQK